jgi:8-hydroxy-5-deazaflavin:NADPH oxidoreductase
LTVKVAVFGKGHVGGGLADLWERAGHQVKRMGRNGGDVSDVDVVVISVPGNALADAIGKLKGAEGKTVIDATNRFGVEPPAGFKSNAEFVKSKTNGPTAKSFNINFAALYGKISGERAKPGNLWCGDEEARAAVERLSRDAGYDPICAGPLTNAGDQEHLIKIIFAINQAGMGQFFYRIAKPGQL